jgi:hypothetical protein
LGADVLTIAMENVFNVPRLSASALFNSRKPACAARNIDARRANGSKVKHV